MREQEANYVREHLAAYDDLTAQIECAVSGLQILESFAVAPVCLHGHSYHPLVMHETLREALSATLTSAATNFLRIYVEALRHRREQLPGLVLSEPRPTGVPVEQAERPEVRSPAECVTSDCD